MIHRCFCQILPHSSLPKSRPISCKIRASNIVGVVGIIRQDDGDRCYLRSVAFNNDPILGCARESFGCLTHSCSPIIDWDLSMALTSRIVFEVAKDGSDITASDGRTYIWIVKGNGLGDVVVAITAAMM